MSKITVELEATGRNCPYCRFPLKQAMTAELCDGCGALHHVDCWQDGGGCAVLGCARAGSVSVPAATQAPVAPPPAPIGKAPPPGAPVPPRTSPPGVAPTLTLPRMPLAAGLPLELWLVIAGFGIPGAILVVKMLQALPDAFEAMGSSLLGFRIGLALLLLVLLVGAMGAGMIWIAWRLHGRDRTARGMAFVVAGTVTLSVLLSDNSTGSETLALLGACLGAAILAFSPAVRELFGGAESEQAGVPTTVVVARVTLIVFCIFAGTVALAYFLLATFEGKYVVVGLLLAGLVVTALVLAPRLLEADRDARRNLAIAVGGAVLLILILGRFSTGLMIPVSLALAATACLWLPTDARAFFGDAPLGTQRRG